MIYDLVDLSDWKKKKQILMELELKDIDMSEREFRKRVEVNNKLFKEHLAKYFIAHSSKGYIATNDKDIIINSLKDNNKRAMTMIMINNEILKALSERDNLTLEME